ncbi:multi-sensor hybrid histidine kinase, variant [Capsaspora owczarzaki ATCC 30864]|uniref:histidine kinase n=1 Tax=Capsaspora owczarzaki (strain ATCC 30864) TaxID=595528 RepID=E9C2U9_CAPO3|nr:multi-sensor hybrid histidine kinase [Capsaspora owczarzaki ATCC 30864]XP_011270166.1 multi-sensor hybrid histidine kinase, variant [Capsaspora owczarzaki ATCC 30864]KJE91554.1 multi-sensor hybrid histidine kinase [Capsaspora owczarzaki ATCC 30864]|eukprot:XP_004349432.1 multi-sensor hybrid histidine kinase [Capsaspora owczarzaki ATCC 30864]
MQEHSTTVTGDASAPHNVGGSPDAGKPAPSQSIEMQDMSKLLPPSLPEATVHARDQRQQPPHVTLNTMPTRETDGHADGFHTGASHDADGNNANHDVESSFHSSSLSKTSSEMCGLCMGPRCRRIRRRFRRAKARTAQWIHSHTPAWLSTLARWIDKIVLAPLPFASTVPSEVVRIRAVSLLLLAYLPYLIYVLSISEPDTLGYGLAIGYLALASLGYFAARCGPHATSAGFVSLAIYIMSVVFATIQGSVAAVSSYAVIAMLISAVSCPVWFVASIYVFTFCFLFLEMIFDSRVVPLALLGSVFINLLFGTSILLAAYVHHWDLNQLEQQRATSSKNEKKYRNIFDNSHEAIVMIDKNDEIIEANRTFFELYKIPRDHRCGSQVTVHFRLAELFDKQSRRELRRVLASTAGTSQTRTCELDSVALDGQAYPIRLVASSLRTAEDDMSISERTLASSTPGIVPAASTAPEPHATRESAGFRFWRRWTRNAAGASPAATHAQAVRSERSAQPLLQGPNQSTISHAQAANPSARSEGFTSRLPSADTHCEVDMFDIHDYTDEEDDANPVSPLYQYQPRGTPVPPGWYRKPTRLVSIINLTDQRRVNAAESEALKEKQANEAKSRFLANMSHEVRTPLNCILGMTQIMMTTSLNNEQSDYLDTIKVSAQILLTVINDILDFSKIEAGQLSIDAIPFNFVQITENIVDLLFPSAATKNLLLSCFIDPQLPRVLVGDPNRFQQILVNLVSNGIKFTTSGSVSLRCLLDSEVDDDHLLARFEVVDTGIGIEADALDRLFQRFSQVDSSITRSYGGTGLGLVICKSLVTLMGGTIGVDSTRGEGSRFWFTIKFRKPTETDTDAIATSRVRVKPPPQFASQAVAPQERHSTERSAVQTSVDWAATAEPYKPATEQTIPSTLELQSHTTASCMSHLQAVIVSPRPSFTAALKGFLDGWNVTSQAARSWAAAQQVVQAIARETAPGTRSHIVALIDHPYVLVEPNEPISSPDREVVTNIDWQALLMQGAQPIFFFPDRRVETHAVVLTRWPASHVMIGPIRQSSLFAALKQLRCSTCGKDVVNLMHPDPPPGQASLPSRNSAYSSALTVMALPTGQRLPSDMHEHLAPVSLDYSITPPSGVVAPEFPAPADDPWKAVGERNVDELDVPVASAADVAAERPPPQHEAAGEKITNLLPSPDLRRTRLRAASEQSFVGTPASGRSLKLLVVEDNLINQKVVCTMLRKAGYRFDVAVNGQEAVDLVVAASAHLEGLAQAGEHVLELLDSAETPSSAQHWCPYDLILMDCQMPVLDGYEATMALRKLETKYRTKGVRQLPIIAMTAEALPQDRARCFECGMTGYISKPINFAQLLEQLRQCSSDSGSTSSSSSATGYPSHVDDPLANVVKPLDPGVVQSKAGIELLPSSDIPAMTRQHLVETESRPD